MQHLQKDAYVAVGNVVCSSLVKDLWDQLTALYAPTGITSQYKAFSQALGIQIIDLSDHSNHRRSDDLPITMASQINALTSTYDKMSTTGLQLPDNLRTMILLNVLPSSYHPLIFTIIQTTTPADFTLDKTIPKVISKAQLRSTSQINHHALVHRLFTSGLDKSEINQTNTIHFFLLCHISFPGVPFLCLPSLSSYPGTPHIHRTCPLTPMPFLILLPDRGHSCLSLLSHGQLLLQLILSYLLHTPLTHLSFHDIP